MLLYSTRVDIRLINVSRVDKIKSNGLVNIFNGEAAFDFHYANQKLCWTNYALECIQCDGFDGLEMENKVFELRVKLICFIFNDNFRLKILALV